MFNIGDVVRLKSGGPKMTITGIVKRGPHEQSEDSPEYQVHWFWENKPATTVFPGEALDLIRLESSKNGDSDT
jgi:uncharacterized protein YodC (DUF2158 family)